MTNQKSPVCGSKTPTAQLMDSNQGQLQSSPTSDVDKDPSESTIHLRNRSKHMRRSSTPSPEPVSKHIKTSKKSSQSSCSLLRERSMQSIRSKMLKVAFPMKFVDAPPFPRPIIGSWYLSPERHFIESFLLSLIGILTIYLSGIYFSSYNANSIVNYVYNYGFTDNGNSGNGDNINIGNGDFNINIDANTVINDTNNNDLFDHNNNNNNIEDISFEYINSNIFQDIESQNTAFILNIIQIILKYLLTIDLIAHFYFKLSKIDDLFDLNGLLHMRYNVKFFNKNGLWLLQPCAFSHCLIVLLLWIPSIHTIRTNQYLLTTACGTAAAMLFPDTSHCKKFCEKTHFYVQHILVFFSPYFFYTLQVIFSKQSFPFFTLVMQDYGIFLLYHFVFLEIISIVFGINLNYLMSPPPKGPAMIFGRVYRIIVTTIMWVCCVAAGYIVPEIISFIVNRFDTNLTVI